MESLSTVTRTTVRCLVCGCGEVRTDEVLERGLVLLAECRRCSHRWTRRSEALRVPGAAPAPSAPQTRVGNSTAA